jgi:hypothetical protein
MGLIGIKFSMKSYIFKIMHIFLKNQINRILSESIYRLATFFIVDFL